MKLTGTSILGYEAAAPGHDTFRAIDPTTGTEIDPAYHAASPVDLERAAQLATAAFPKYAALPARRRAAFLRRAAEAIEALGEPLWTRMTAETALPEARARMETARTCNQLRMFADLIEEGSWVDARLDRPDPAREPVPKPDVRSMLRPLGPVAVFGPANFPLAFSVAGGDTASALAAGCSVIVLAHYAHPGTSEMTGRALRDAAQATELPEGVFSLLFSHAHDIGQKLVLHPAIRAVAFTGSRRGGEALRGAVSRRPEPVPFFAEMSSVNPIFILPGALETRHHDIAHGLHGSVTLGVGQFCTNPGVVFIPESDATASFVTELTDLFRETPGGTMLTQAIESSYREGIQRLAGHANVETLVGQDQAVGASLFRTRLEHFVAAAELSDEVFGPATLLVTYDDPEQLRHVVERMSGQLTATIHAAESDADWVPPLSMQLEDRVGRIVYNGFPTGVEVGAAMVHGGPYPSTSDGVHTSVGTRAIGRFCRPVCWQNAPADVLSDELQDHNPLGIYRQVDGRLTRDAV